MEMSADGRLLHIGPCPLKRCVFVVLTDAVRHSIQRLLMVRIMEDARDGVFKYKLVKEWAH